MIDGEKRYKIKNIEKFDKDMEQNENDIIMSSMITGLFAIATAGSFFLANSSELHEIGMIMGTVTSLVSAGSLALLVKKIRDRVLLENKFENESSGKNR